jgi:hypothetical protein
MDARALLGVGFALLWSWCNTVDPENGFRIIGLQLLGIQFSAWVAACVLLTRTPVTLYAQYVCGVWTLLLLACELVFKYRPEMRETVKVDPNTAPLVLDCWTLSVNRRRGTGDPLLEPAQQIRGCDDVVISVRDAVKHPETSSGDPEVPGIRQLMHVSWFSALIAWAIAGVGVLQQTPVGSDARRWTQWAALTLAAFDWQLRADLNVESEQVGVVHQLCFGKLQGASAVLRISVLQIVGICLCTVSDAIAVWNGDAASVCAYVFTVVVLPWILSALYRAAPFSSSNHHNHQRVRGRGCVARLECVVATWPEQRALCEGAWWTWFFLVQLVGWQPTLIPSFSSPLAEEADAAATAFSGMAVFLFGVSVLEYFQKTQFAEACVRSNLSLSRFRPHRGRFHFGSR